MIEIVKKTKKIVVINKPEGVPSQSDNTGDADAMTMTSDLLRSFGEDPSLWLVHRLDRVVGGLMVLARSKRAAAGLSASLTDRSFVKIYFAVVEGCAEGGMLKDLLYRDARAGKSFVVDRMRGGAREACLDYRRLASCNVNGEERTLVAVRLYTGRYHQIRAQLSNAGYPIVGDKKYGSRDREARLPALFSSSLTFELENERISTFAAPDVTKYPWSLFDRKCYELPIDLMGGEGELR